MLKVPFFFSGGRIEGKYEDIEHFEGVQPKEGTPGI